MSSPCRNAVLSKCLYLLCMMAICLRKGKRKKEKGKRKKEKGKRKKGRNYALLIKWLEAHPNDAYLHYQLGIDFELKG